MYAFWSQFRRGASAAVLTCWLWLSLGSAFTHACGQGEFHNPGLRTDAACVSCQWAGLEKTTEVTSAPTAQVESLIPREFTDRSQPYVYVPSFVRPGRAPPA